MAKTTKKKEQQAGKFPVRVNIHLGNITPERAATSAQAIADIVGAKVYLIPEPDFDEDNPGGLLFVPKVS